MMIRKRLLPLLLLIVLVLSSCSGQPGEASSGVQVDGEQTPSVIMMSALSTRMMGYIITTGDGLIVVDGGLRGDAGLLLEQITKNGGHVKAWFITHYHDDHTGALVQLLEDGADIEIDTIVCDLPTEEEVQLYDSGKLGNIQQLNAAITANGIPITVPEVGDNIAVGDVTATILRVYNSAVTANFGNNSGIVFKTTSGDKSMLFLGDLGAEGGQELLDTVDPQLIKSDAVQAAHHGQAGVNMDVYDVIAPTTIFWSTPGWLWENSGGGFRTPELQRWALENGVYKNYIAKDGTIEVPFTDF